MPAADPASEPPASQRRTLPFWSINKIYWLLYILPLAAWFAMDGSEMFFFDKDPKHPERVWFKLGVYLLLVNMISLLVWREDKRRAERGDWRVSEKTLVYLCTLGGLPGALLSMRMYRHKSRKWSLQLRLFFWSALLVVFAFLVLPHSWSYANDARWGICLFSLFWWNLSIAGGIVRVHRDNGRVLWRYLGLLFGIAVVCVGLAAGGVYFWEGRKHDPWNMASAAIITGGLVLSIFNEVWLSLRGLRGKLPGWDPIAPAGVK
ncbi:MAG: DUF1294 domain-containing protein [Planctomycetota bacterium]